MVRRGLAILVPTVSALLLLATLGFWVRSYWAADGMSWGKDARVFTAGCDRGGVLVAHIAFHVSSDAKVSISIPSGLQVTHFPPAGYLSTLSTLRPSPRRFLGFSCAFGYEGGVPMLRYRATAVAFPLWFPAILFAIAPAWWLARTRKRRLRDARRRSGQCAACGYDLRASPGRCPECGAVDQRLAPS